MTRLESKAKAVEVTKESTMYEYELYPLGNLRLHPKSRLDRSSTVAELRRPFRGHCNALTFECHMYQAPAAPAMQRRVHATTSTAQYSLLMGLTNASRVVRCEANIHVRRVYSRATRPPDLLTIRLDHGADASCFQAPTPSHVRVYCLTPKQ
jgi:hypothetical protein